MLTEKDIGRSVVYKCVECGLSDTRVKNKHEEKMEDAS